VRLYDLETLDLRDNDIEELPSRIVQLTKLQYLLLAPSVLFSNGGLITKIPDGIGNMSNLRVITGFNITQSSLGEVAELRNLNSRRFEEYERHEEILLSSLCKLGSCKLQFLWIDSDDPTPFQFLDSWSPLPYCLQRFVMGYGYYVLKIPKWIAPALTSLAYLEINLEEATGEVTWRDACLNFSAASFRERPGRKTYHQRPWFPMFGGTPNLQ
jgi:disease resistance protein RPM1